MVPLFYKKLNYILRFKYPQGYIGGWQVLLMIGATPLLFLFLQFY